VHDSVNALHSLVLFQLASSSNALFASVSGQFLEILVCIGGSIIGSGARQEPAQPPVVCVCVCVLAILRWIWASSRLLKCATA
jgi:hypothetical protein